MEQILIPEEVIDHFGISNIPVYFSLSGMVDDDSQIGRHIRTLLKKVEALLDSPPSDPPFWFTQSQGLDFDTRRLFVTERLIGEAIAQRRLDVLVEDYKAETKRPYQHSSLAELVPDSDGLVHFDAFDNNRSIFPGLRRGQTVFEILPTIPTALNSMYWAIHILRSLSDVEKLVRLDPLMNQPECNYGPIFYKMVVYGKALDWDALASIRQPDHARFQPDIGWQKDIQFTDLVWSPVDEGVEFVCEEVPKLDTFQLRPSRYFHAIFIPARKSFIHCDGAIRLYSADSLRERLNSHVRKAGKMGKRIKVFAVNGDIPAETWTSLVCAYFVWNRDIVNYFNAGGHK
jgi:hypothetical protein